MRTNESESDDGSAVEAAFDDFPTGSKHLLLIDSLENVHVSPVGPSSLVLGNDLLLNFKQRTARQHAELITLHPAVPPIVSFCVGDTLFYTSRDNIAKDPQSLLFVLVNNHYQSAFTSKETFLCEPVRIPERDPKIFGMLLNLLRGYPNPIPREWMAPCYHEAVYYGLGDSWARRYPMQSPCMFHFPACGRALSSQLTLGVATPPLGPGKHFLNLRVTAGEKMGIGVMAASSVARQGEAPGTEGRECAVYWNDGRAVRHFADVVTTETTYQYPIPSIVRVAVDTVEGLVSWTLNDEFFVAMMRLPRDTTYAYCVFLSSDAQVNVV